MYFSAAVESPGVDVHQSVLTAVINTAAFQKTDPDAAVVSLNKRTSPTC